jgi:hypothetical protein
VVLSIRPEDIELSESRREGDNVTGEWTTFGEVVDFQV